MALNNNNKQSRKNAYIENERKFWEEEFTAFDPNVPWEVHYIGPALFRESPERERQKAFQRLKEQHNAELRRKVGHYIQNYLPIRLLQVSNMEFVHRGNLEAQVNEQIENNSFACHYQPDCGCFEKIKDELKYSILSHRWGFPELTFGEFDTLHKKTTQDSHNQATRDSFPSLDHTIVSRMQQLWGETFKASLDKLLQTCELSAQMGCKYVWIDTICINKESSAELDESIRSMYAWYRDSHICIVYLNQTSKSPEMTEDPWFTRGWTLQELLAPKRLKFFSSSWEAITRRENDKGLDDAERQAAKNHRDRPPLWSRISWRTGIPIDDLLDFQPGLYDIGKRMKWASTRTTTRVEDMAYCMIGIFRVNLSIAYGEKEGAFYRLQAEIMQNSDDQSLFDWDGEASAYNSMFALSPGCFSGESRVRTNNNPPINPNADQNLTVAANFEQRTSRVLYHKSEVPQLSLWKGSSATTFTILGFSFKDGESTLLLLERVDDDQHYKRVKVVETKIEERLPKKEASEILIK